MKILNHLKQHPNIYIIICSLSAILSLYVDYRSSMLDLDDKTNRIERESVEIEKLSTMSESDRVRQDILIHEALREIISRGLELERRVMILEKESRENHPPLLIKEENAQAHGEQIGTGKSIDLAKPQAYFQEK